GARVWVKEKEQLVPATVNSCGDGTLVVTTDYGEVLYLQQAEVTRERVYAMHQSSIDGVEDMSALAELHEAAIMHNLYQRYQKDNIYHPTAGQPYKRILALYDLERVDLIQAPSRELPPHIFVVQRMLPLHLKRHDSQIRCREDESTKLLLQFLSVMSQNQPTSIRENHTSGAGHRDRAAPNVFPHSFCEGGAWGAGVHRGGDQRCSSCSGQEFTMGNIEFMTAGGARSPRLSVNAANAEDFKRQTCCTSIPSRNTSKAHPTQVFVKQRICPVLQKHRRGGGPQMEEILLERDRNSLQKKREDEVSQPVRSPPNRSCSRAELKRMKKEAPQGHGAWLTPELRRRDPLTGSS
ncbi:unconventional myosin-X isoform X1, partial [Lates japonicus]